MERENFSDSAASCVLRLQAVLQTLKPVERRVADYILRDPQDVLSLTIIELSAKTGASYATINRLINRIGFTGFKELKKFLYRDIINHNSIINLRHSSLDFLDVITLSQGATAEEICNNIYDLSSKVLDESHNIISIAAMEKAAEKILSTGNFCIIGTGLSGISARYAYSRFFRIGVPCYYEEDSTLYGMKTSLLEKNDLLFAISSSGRSASILDCVRQAKENQADVISLTDYAISPLSRLATINLFTTPRNVSQFMNIDMPLVIGQIFIIDVLYMICCVKMGKRSSEIYIKTKRSADSEKVRDITIPSVRP
ncbi:MAG: MurR/RpiR family transcriptional regulator [Treponema sp.]|jgi:DNA-binding MurR/RpiR family transcriptional regulator|nr:MurR/RpiR family transcriptional regulator [Treponema sp.]